MSSDFSVAAILFNHVTRFRWEEIKARSQGTAKPLVVLQKKIALYYNVAGFFSLSLSLLAY